MNLIVPQEIQPVDNVNKPPDKYSEWFDHQISCSINLSNNLQVQPNDGNMIFKQKDNNFQYFNNIHFGAATHNNKFINTFKFNKSSIHNFSFIDLPKFNYNNEIIKIGKKNKNSIDKIHNKIYVPKEMPTDLSKKDLDIFCTKHDTKTKNKLTKKLIQKTDKSIFMLNKTTKTKQIPIHPSKDQTIILLKWFNECTKLYNYCCDKFNQQPKFFNAHYSKTKMVIFKELYGDDDKNCPYAILTYVIKTFHSNLKSCYTNLKNGNITHFEMKHINVSKSQSIAIPKDAIQTKSFYGSLLGNHIKGLENIASMNIINDCHLIYDRTYKSFTLNIPSSTENKILPGREPIVALDPGEKIFMAYHGLDSYGKIGIDIRKKILLCQSKIKKWQTILANGTNNKNGKIKKANRKKIRRKIQLHFDKIKNVVKELHNKTALFLCRNYDRILIPKFETQKMISNGMSVDHKKKLRNYNIAAAYEEDADYGKSVKKHYNKKSRLSKRVKYVLSQLSHYKFRQHLLNKSQEYGCVVRVVGEEYTSMTCTNCGLQSKSYNNRIKSCRNCKYKIDRDIGGARNILIKNLKEELHVKANKSGVDASQE